MITKRKLQAVFPLKGEITTQIIAVADVSDPDHCIGHHTLFNALHTLFPELKRNQVKWGSLRGRVVEDEDEYCFTRTLFYVTTSDHTQMIDVEQPREITFVLE